MLFWKKDNNYISPVEHVRLRQRVVQLEQELKDIKDGHVKKLIDDVECAKFEVDFDTMAVFSIERNQNGARAYTVIGYYLNEPEQYGLKKAVHEWTLYCSMREHERLVTDFQKWKNARSKK